MTSVAHYMPNTVKCNLNVLDLYTYVDVKKYMQQIIIMYSRQSLNLAVCPHTKPRVKNIGGISGGGTSQRITSS